MAILPLPRSGKTSLPRRLRVLPLRAMTLACLLALMAFDPFNASFITASPGPLPSGARETDSQRVELLKRVGGNLPAALPLPDGSILAAEGSALLRLAPSPTQAGVLFEVARVDPGYGPILDLVANSGYAIALATQGLMTFGLQDSALAPPVSFIPGGGQSLSARGNLIIVAARESGLRLLSIDSAGALTSVSALPTPGPALDVILDPANPLAYVAGGDAGIMIVDTSDPASPRVTATVSLGRPAESVAISGSLLAVGSRERVLMIDPASAQPVIGQFAPLVDGRQMVIEGGYIYIADARDGLKILWLAAPDRPLQVFGEADRPALDVAVAGDTLYLAGQDGLRILDVSDHQHPLQIATLPLPSPPLDLALSPDRHVFAALGEAGVAVIDAQNLAQPALKKVIPLGAPARAVLYDDGVLYAAADAAGLSVIDAPPGGEVLLATLALPGPALDLALRGDGLYVAAGDAGLVGVDVSRPARPLVSGILGPDPGHVINSVTISGKRAYASQGDSFIVADVTSAARAGRLARMAAPATQVVADDTYLYALSGGQLAIYDARATADPLALRIYRGLTSAIYLAVGEGRVFVGSDQSGPDTVALDVRFPDLPYELDNVGQTGFGGRPVIVSGGVILPVGSAGLRAYALTEGGALAPAASYEPIPGASVVSADGGERLAVAGRAGWAILDRRTLERLAGRDDPDVRALALNGERLGIVSGDARLAVISWAEERSQTIGWRQFSQPITGIAWASGVLLASDASGLLLLDPNTLISARRVATPAPANGVAARGNWAYLPLADGSLAAINLGDLTGGMQLLGSVESPRPLDLIRAPDGSILALADTSLNRLSISDQTNPTLAQLALLPRVMQRGFMVDDLFIGLDPANSLYLFAVPQQAIETLGFNQIVAPASDIAPGWPTSYAAYGDSGWGSVDLPSLSAGSLVSPVPARALLRQDNTLFALGDNLTVWNVELSGSPRQLAEIALPSPGRAIDQASNGDLLLSLESGLSIVQWDGSALIEIGTIAAPAPLDRAAWLGHRVFAARHDGGLWVVDVADPSQPYPLFTAASPRSLPLEGGAYVNDLLPLDDTRLLVSWNGGVDVFDVVSGADAPPPALVATFPLGQSAATRLALSIDGKRAALAFADGSLVALDLSDPARPALVGQASLPAPDPGGVALDDQAVYVANGVCGLRVFGLSGPTLPEVGYWRSGAALNLALSAPGVVAVADSSALSVLGFDPALPPLPPPLPQSPFPASDTVGVLLDPTLAWGPPPDRCDPLRYEIHLGQQPDPPLVSAVSGEARLQVSGLAPLSQYFWQVTAIDRQGDSSRGPVWRFATVPADFPGVIPPSPPSFLAWMQDHPEISMGLGGALALLVGISLWRLLRFRGPARPPTAPPPRDRRLPEWYSTRDSDDDSPP